MHRNLCYFVMQNGNYCYLILTKIGTYLVASLTEIVNFKKITIIYWILRNQNNLLNFLLFYFIIYNLLRTQNQFFSHKYSFCCPLCPPLDSDSSSGHTTLPTGARPLHVRTNFNRTPNMKYHNHPLDSSPAVTCLTYRKTGTVKLRGAFCNFPFQRHKNCLCKWDKKLTTLFVYIQFERYKKEAFQVLNVIGP
jgi:hypothetical protein